MLPFTDSLSSHIKEILMVVRCLHACTFSLGLVARHVLTGVTETGRGKQSLSKRQREIRQDAKRQARKRSSKNIYIYTHTRIYAYIYVCVSVYADSSILGVTFLRQSKQKIIHFVKTKKTRGLKWIE